MLCASRGERGGARVGAEDMNVPGGPKLPGGVPSTGTGARADEAPEVPEFEASLPISCRAAFFAEVIFLAAARTPFASLAFHEDAPEGSDGCTLCALPSSGMASSASSHAAVQASSPNNVMSMCSRSACVLNDTVLLDELKDVAMDTSSSGRIGCADCTPRLNCPRTWC